MESGKLARERRKKFQSVHVLDIDGRDSYNDTVWKKNYETLKQFMDAFRRSPYTDEVYQGVKLYLWLIQ